MLNNSIYMLFMYKNHKFFLLYICRKTIHFPET